MVERGAEKQDHQGNDTDSGSQETMEKQTEQFFISARSGWKLAARLDRPADRPLAYAIFTHCFTCSKDYHVVSRISHALADRGIAVLRFDFTGLGESEGNFSDTNFSSNLEDLLDAAQFLRENFGPPEILIGHSLGGAAALAAARFIPDCSAVVTIAAPSDTAHLVPVLTKSAPAIETEGEADALVAGRTFRIKRQLLEDLQQHNLLRVIAELGRPLLVLHSPSDRTVHIDNAHRIFEAAKHPKSFVSIAGADHLLTGRPTGEYVASVISAWVARYIGRNYIGRNQEEDVSLLPKQEE